MAFIIFFLFCLKKFEKVEKTGIISSKFSLQCTPSVILRVKYYGPQTLPTGYTWGRMEPTHENFQKVKLGEVLRPFLKRSLCKPGLVMMSLISSSHQAKLSPSPSLPLLLLRSKTNFVKCRSQLKNLLWRRYQWDHLQLQFGLAVDDTLK